MDPLTPEEQVEWDTAEDFMIKQEADCWLVPLYTFVIGIVVGTIPWFLMEMFT